MASLRSQLAQAARAQPYPIASVCRRVAAGWPEDPWRQWEVLSRDLLGTVLKYLSHLLLSDLVATGRRPAFLFHRIQSILSRPLGGHYAGFLRETARYFRDERIASAFPELVDFLCRADVDCKLRSDGKAFLDLLVQYRNSWAHGKLDDPEAIREIAETVAALSETLLAELDFLTRYPLTLESGQPLMGSDPALLGSASGPLVVLTAGGRTLRPLLVKLRGDDLALLVDFDERGQRLAYAGASSFEKLTAKQLKSGPAAQLFQDLVALQARVRALDAELPEPDWASFLERAAIVSERTRSLHEEMRKYVPAWYVPRPGWEGPAGRFQQFLAQDRTLLAISGVQGTGKSALVARLADLARAEGHAVLFVNAQRFTFAEVSWSGNPFPEYFARQLHYARPFDADAFRRLVKSAPPAKQVVLFVDAVNEVDGIEQKWNRFRAMELLLEWIAAIAQPGIKVVVGFRLDAYEEYGYLEAEELPAQLPHVAWGGTNPRKPWVLDLEPLTATEAEALYERLQQLPELGMAPRLSWPQIRDGLGGQLADFVGNPLLFSVFLRIHHGTDRFLATRLEDLFERYAAQLTGADQLLHLQPTRRAWEWLKNACTTPKERFLADLVEAMVERGGSSVLVGTLDPKRTRDRRLLAVLAAPESRIMVELREGGLLVEEKIDEAPGSAGGERRVTTVAELHAAAMEEPARRLRHRARVRETVVGVPALALGIVAITGFLIRFWMEPTLGGQALQAGATPELAAQLGSHAALQIWSTLALIVTLFSITSVLLNLSPRDHVRAISPQLLVRSAAALCTARETRITLRLFAPALLLGFAALVVSTVAGASDFQLMVGCIAFFGGALYEGAGQRLNLVFIRHEILGLPGRLAARLLNDSARYQNSETYRRSRARPSLAMATSGVLWLSAGLHKRLRPLASPLGNLPGMEAAPVTVVRGAARLDQLWTSTERIILPSALAMIAGLLLLGAAYTAWIRPAAQARNARAAVVSFRTADWPPTAGTQVWSAFRLSALVAASMALAGTLGF